MNSHVFRIFFFIFNKGSYLSFMGLGEAGEETHCSEAYTKRWSGVKLWSGASEWSVCFLFFFFFILEWSLGVEIWSDRS